MTTHYDNCNLAAKKIIENVGKTIVIGVPLGIGKPVGLLNALYQLASDDKSIHLTIVTGLTLARPLYTNELEKRLAEPILERLIKNYEDPLYEKARVLQQVPDNIKIIEFFLSTAKYLHNSYVQQNYISSNYTSVVRDLLHYSVNVIAQQVAVSSSHPDHYSLSCNSDLFDDAIQGLNKFKREGKQIAIVAEVNKNLPFLYGDAAVIKSSVFTDIIDTGRYPALFALPREELSAQDHLVGLYTSSLIKDDSSLQVGIGKLSNAIANALILRHSHNNIYQDLLKQLSAHEKFGQMISSVGSLSTFPIGLYGPTEMLSDEYIQLYQADILKKRVYDNIGLQLLLNLRKITENITPNTLDVLLEQGLINTKITQDNFNFLQKFGILTSDVNYQSGYFILSSGEKIPADLSMPEVKKLIIEKYLGKKLISGKIIHAGFFLGSIDLYQKLNNLSPEELKLIEMTTIDRTNSFHWSYELAQLQHQNARFINSAMMVTLGGVVISDGLNNLQEVSGVGGQFDFVYISQKLKNARSIMIFPAVRKSKQGTTSNIVWNYSNFTVPRFFRDIVVNEYGIADCRSKTDSDIIKAMLNITDSRFQQDLLKTAKKFGKLESHYEIPSIYQNNLPESFAPIIKEFQLKGYCKPYPFGSDLTEDEQVIANALLSLKNFSKLKLFYLMLTSLFFMKSDAKFEKYLTRMNLQNPRNFKEFLYKKILKRSIKLNA